MPRRARVEEESDDTALFRTAVKDAIPLAATPRTAVRARRMSQPVGLQSQRDEQLTRQAPLDTAPAAFDDDVFVRDGVPRNALRKLRRGEPAVRTELDLHGARRDEAYALLCEFLDDAARTGQRAVRIIHGKGIGSKDRQPVLKRMVKAWLAQRAEVLAFCHAPETHGGTGALLVLLKGTAGTRRAIPPAR